MKLKNIFKYLIAGILILYLNACSNATEADQLFEQTPTERLNARKTELKDALLSSEFGWKAVYFTDNTVLGGYTHLFKFAPDGTVQMASDFDGDTAVYKSEYEIQLGSTVSVTFTTKNRIHLLSDSDSYPIAALESEGYKGDFQFLYYGQENGDIVFRTNRTVKELRFVKATAADWADLPKNLIMEQNVIGGASRPLFRLLETNDGSTKHQFDFTYTTPTRYAEANSIEAGYTVSYDMGIGFTPTGIVVSPAVEVGGQKLTNFVYNDVDGSFTATGTGGVTAVIKYTDKPLLLTDDYKMLLPGQPLAWFGFYADDYTVDAPTNSPLFYAELAKINAALPAGQEISSIQIYTNHSLGTFIYYTFVGRAALFHFVDVVEDAPGKKVILKHKSWSNATTAAFVTSLDKYLTDPNGIYLKRESFRLFYSEPVYTFTSSSSPFRMTTWKLN
ncbi:DUF4302 domain-containing protein [Flavobacterium reichenbachii]|uniref:DUF4302 domain-containing protein n=1 Tax=Flavobacterium reichenbachii TaxID=362418 RepID=A0A085ZJE1_9FLAO|nr:DUF4302 domain-containing protein [Flavobacterium reichenbachii]KFF04555.1 hypothetical protein IW19_02985 [Flavobacterium reichenbachii]OXB09266.1 hypothetical protein B0A68_23925 [Flavobacterium reichenbachii]